MVPAWHPSPNGVLRTKVLHTSPLTLRKDGQSSPSEGFVDSTQHPSHKVVLRTKVLRTCPAPFGRPTYYAAKLLGSPGTSSNTFFFIGEGKCFFNASGVPVRTGNVP